MEKTNEELAMEIVLKMIDKGLLYNPASQSEAEKYNVKSTEMIIDALKKTVIFLI